MRNRAFRRAGLVTGVLSLCAAAAVLLAASCDLPGGFGTGTLTLLLPETEARGTDAASRAALSDSFTGTLVYRLNLTGPRETQSLEAGGGGTTVSLPAGEWTIAALAYDPGDMTRAVGSGSAAVTVSAGQNNSVRIPMTVEASYEAGLREIYIHSEADLRRIGTDFAIDGSFITHFYLERDIVLSRPWTAVGSGSAPFKAVFDGQGHTITVRSFGGAVQESNAVFQGFFALVDNAVIKNIHLNYELAGPVDIRTADPSTYYDSYAGGIAGRAFNTAFEHVRLTGNFSVIGNGNSSLSVGGIAGQAGQASIDDCHVSGAVGGDMSGGALWLGGIGGYLYNTIAINRSSFTGAVEGTAPGENCWFGGIAGDTDGDISASYVSARVRGRGDAAYAGGIAGRLGGGGSIERCYAWADVSADGTSAVSVGGIAGDNNSTITTCYARGEVLGEHGPSGPNNKYAGGIAGYTAVGTALSYCAALNDSIRFSTASFVEGVCGDALTTGVTFTSNYAASDISITRSGSGSNNSNLTGDRTYTRGAFTGPPAGAVYTDATKLNWNFSGGWKFISAYSYPVLSWQTTPPADPSLF